ncbi:MAG: hypothetical protein H6817_06145 [Phycisphaerales bacterium]|nr:hypothetical protein [Phycisphaerales bacterium]
MKSKSVKQRLAHGFLPMLAGRPITAWSVNKSKRYIGCAQALDYLLEQNGVCIAE